MKKYLLFIAVFLSHAVFAQNVGIGTTTPDSSAALDVHSTNKGLLLPTMTTAQRNAIKNPAFGLLVFDSDKGTVMFFDGNTWRGLAFTDETKTIPESTTNNNPSASAGFGSRVAISGDYAVIGSPKQTISGKTNAGAVYIFHKATSGWQQQQVINDPSAVAYDYFGSAVAISGDYIAIGSSTKLVGTNNYQGKVFVYKRNGNTWGGDGSFTKPGGASSDYFGWSVGISNLNSTTVLLSVGIPYSDVKTTDAGEVYCYSRSSSTNKWTFIQSIAPGDLAASDLFGTSISIDQDYMVIGAPYQDNTAYSLTDAGAAYVYVYGGGVWTLQQKLTGSTTSSQFGLALSISGSNLAVGAPWAITYTNTSSSVYIYTRTGSTWSNTNYLYIFNYEIVPGASQINSNSTSTNKSISIADLTFGMSVALDGDNLMVGASGGLDYPNGGASYYSDWAGAVYFYKNYSGTTYTKTQVIKSDYPTGADLFGESVGISNGNYIIANPHAIVGSNINAGNIYFGNVQ